MLTFDVVDLKQIYNSVYLDLTANVRSLLRKVQWDIRFYFARRGGENMHSMDKNTFKLVTDRNTGVKYISRAQDEATKNHKETDQDIIFGFMPEIKGDKMCPVASYLKYFNALSAKSDKLWQTAKFNEFSPITTEWYYGKMGHNKLDCFVSDLCTLVGIDKHYTNHSLRVTAITLLTRNNFNNKQIMSITSHKSSKSLEIYQRVNAEEKLIMGKTLATEMSKTPRKRANETVSKPSEEPENKRQLVEIPNEDDPDFNFCAEDILKIVEQCEQSSTQEMAVQNISNTNNNNNVTMTRQVVSQTRSPTVPNFNNCRIGSITINMNKY